jgi:hypothetical protein
MYFISVQRLSECTVLGGINTKQLSSLSMPKQNFSGDKLKDDCKEARYQTISGVTRGGGLGVSKPPKNSEVLTKLSRIFSSMENTSVTT